MLNLPLSSSPDVCPFLPASRIESSSIYHPIVHSKPQVPDKEETHYFRTPSSQKHAKLCLNADSYFSSHLPTKTSTANPAYDLLQKPTFSLSPSISCELATFLLLQSTALPILRLQLSKFAARNPPPRSTSHSQIARRATSGDAGTYPRGFTGVEPCDVLPRVFFRSVLAVKTSGSLVFVAHEGSSNADCPSLTD